MDTVNAPPSASISPDGLCQIDAIRVAITPDGRMRRADAAAYLSLSPRTLANMQTRGVGPRSVKVAGRRFYYLADLQAFVASAGKPL